MIVFIMQSLIHRRMRNSAALTITNAFHIWKPLRSLLRGLTEVEIWENWTSYLHFPNFLGERCAVEVGEITSLGRFAIFFLLAKNEITRTN